MKILFESIIYHPGWWITDTSCLSSSTSKIPSIARSRRKVSLPRKRKIPLPSFFFFFVSSADSAITTLISSCRQVRLGRRTEEETSGIPGHRKPLGVRHSLRDGLRIPRVPLFDSIASYPSALARSHSRHAYLPLLISSLSISFLVNLSRVSLRLIATPLFLPPTKLLNDFVGWSNTDRWYQRR